MFYRTVVLQVEIKGVEQHCPTELPAMIETSRSAAPDRLPLVLGDY